MHDFFVSCNDYTEAPDGQTHKKRLHYFYCYRCVEPVALGKVAGHVLFCSFLGGGRSLGESSDHLSGDLFKAAATGRFSGRVLGVWLHMYCIISIIVVQEKAGDPFRIIHTHT